MGRTNFFQPVAAMMAIGLLGSCSGNVVQGGKSAGLDTTKAIASQTKMEGKNLLGKFEAEECTPAAEDGIYTQAECDENLVCVPDTYEMTKGSCRVACGEKGEDGFSKTDEANCPSGRTCQLLATLYVDEIGAFCMEPQSTRDGPCLAPEDKNACTDGRVCDIVSVEKDEQGVPFATGFACRESCHVTPSNSKGNCGGEEICQVSSMRTSIERDAADSKKMRKCTQEKCGPGNAACECTTSKGYFCAEGMNVCMSLGGNCVQEVRWLRMSDFAHGAFIGETCNEVSDHRVCNSSLLDTVENPSTPICIPVSKSSDEGICFAVCSTPSIDKDNDGKIGEDEAGLKKDCPANYECKLDMGRKLGMASKVMDPENPAKVKSCDPTKCEKGKACPAQCGVGDGECTTVETKNGGKRSYCSAPLGHCELNVTPAAG